MIEAYLMHEQERNAQGIPALPLNPEQTTSLCELLQSPPAGKEEFLMNLFTERRCRPCRRSQGCVSGRHPQRGQEFAADRQEEGGADPRHHDRWLQCAAAD